MPGNHRRNTPGADSVEELGDLCADRSWSLMVDARPYKSREEMGRACPYGNTHDDPISDLNRHIARLEATIDMLVEYFGKYELHECNRILEAWRKP